MTSECDRSFYTRPWRPSRFQHPLMSRKKSFVVQVVIIRVSIFTGLDREGILSVKIIQQDNLHLLRHHFRHHQLLLIRSLLLLKSREIDQQTFLTWSLNFDAHDRKYAEELCHMSRLQKKMDIEGLYTDGSSLTPLLISKVLRGDYLWRLDLFSKGTIFLSAIPALRSSESAPGNKACEPTVRQVGSAIFFAVRVENRRRSAVRFKETRSCLHIDRDAVLQFFHHLEHVILDSKYVSSRVRCISKEKSISLDRELASLVGRFHSALDDVFSTVNIVLSVFLYLLPSFTTDPSYTSLFKL